MGVYIKEFEMPKKGLVEIIIAPDGICYELARPLIDTEHAKVTKYYDAIAVPDNGDLIDREKVVKALEDLISARLDWENAAKVEEIRGLDAAICAVIDAKKVIPAERSEDGET